MKEQSVRVNNYTLSTWNEIYSVVQKGHKTKPEYPNGDYSTKKNRTSRLKLKLTKKDQSGQVLRTAQTVFLGWY